MIAGYVAQPYTQASPGTDSHAAEHMVLLLLLLLLLLLHAAA
jgi:hypothetical protein